MNQPHQHDTLARWCSSLRLEELEVGRVHRLMIQLAQDAMGLPLGVPTIVVRGRRPGPVIGITAALHGNELNGIRVIHGLVEKLAPEGLKGTVVAVVVSNSPGYLLKQREFNDGVDLNHIMPGMEHGTESQVWARNLFEGVVSNFDYLIDLHTASFGRVNSLYVRADMMSPLTSRMAYLQRPQIILHNPASDLTLRGAACERGIPAITVEIGDPHRHQPELIRKALVGLRAVLADIGVVARKPRLSAGPEPQICASSKWLYTDQGGILEVFPEVTSVVEEGQELARLTNIFGDVVASYKAPCRGVVIGKSIEPTAQTGARILHLGLLDDERLYQSRHDIKLFKGRAIGAKQGGEDDVV